MTQLLTIREAAKISGVNYQALRIHALKGHLSGQRVGIGTHRSGLFVTTAEDLAQFLIQYRAGAFDGRRLRWNKGSSDNAA